VSVRDFGEQREYALLDPTLMLFISVKPTAGWGPSMKCLRDGRIPKCLVELADQFPDSPAAGWAAG
jgi:hypothetical protein